MNRNLDNRVLDIRDKVECIVYTALRIKRPSKIEFRTVNQG